MNGQRRKQSIQTKKNIGKGNALQKYQSYHK